MTALSRLRHTVRVGNKALGRTTGFQFARVSKIPTDLDRESREIIETVLPFALTAPEEIFNFITAARYVHDAALPGAIAECGVWRGGTMMAAAWALWHAGEDTRDLFMFDTFDGPAAPDERDRHMRSGESAADFLAASGPTTWRATLSDVKQAFSSVPYSSEHVHYVVGPVEQTLPGSVPDEIAVLRLNTDWYSSTKCELDNLYPRLIRGGVLIVHDYGNWQGSKQATDEFLHALGTKPLMVRTAGGSRIAVRP